MWKVAWAKFIGLSWIQYIALWPAVILGIVVFFASGIVFGAIDIVAWPWVSAGRIITMPLNLIFGDWLPCYGVLCQDAYVWRESVHRIITDGSSNITFAFLVYWAAMPWLLWPIRKALSIIDEETELDCADWVGVMIKLFFIYFDYVWRFAYYGMTIVVTVIVLFNAFVNVEFVGIVSTICLWCATIIGAYGLERLLIEEM